MAGPKPHHSPMRFWLALYMCLAALPLWANAPGTLCSSAKWGQVQCIRPDHFAYDTCNAIQTFADRHGLNRDFFARLIWQESRFDPNALSPANARGIAQFIPSTAQKRGLADPYNPADALEHSAQYLAEMVTRFGNEGMAAIGYNGGESRAAGFLEGKGLAPETVDYVPIITGLSAETWRDAPPDPHDMRLSRTEGFLPACLAMAKNRRITPLARPEPEVRPWGVQVAFDTSQARAKAKAAGKTTACRGVLGQQKLQFVHKKHRVAGKPGYIFAQYGLKGQQEAQRLCTAMRRSGCTCRVVEN